MPPTVLNTHSTPAPTATRMKDQYMSVRCRLLPRSAPRATMPAPGTMMSDPSSGSMAPISMAASPTMTRTRDNPAAPPQRMLCWLRPARRAAEAGEARRSRRVHAGVRRHVNPATPQARIPAKRRSSLTSKRTSQKTRVSSDRRVLRTRSVFTRNSPTCGGGLNVSWWSPASPVDPEVRAGRVGSGRVRRLTPCVAGSCQPRRRHEWPFTVLEAPWAGTTVAIARRPSGTRSVSWGSAGTGTRRAVPSPARHGVAAP